MDAQSVARRLRDLLDAIDQVGWPHHHDWPGREDLEDVIAAQDFGPWARRCWRSRTKTGRRANGWCEAREDRHVRHLQLQTRRRPRHPLRRRLPGRGRQAAQGAARTLEDARALKRRREGGETNTAGRLTFAEYARDWVERVIPFSGERRKLADVSPLLVN
jgi:hypothetical protein